MGGDLKLLATLVLDMDKAARKQGLYVGAGRNGDLPDTAASQEGPRWKAAKKLAREILKGE